MQRADQQNRNPTLTEHIKKDKILQSDPNQAQVKNKDNEYKIEEKTPRCRVDENASTAQQSKIVLAMAAAARDW